VPTPIADLRIKLPGSPSPACSTSNPSTILLPILGRTQITMTHLAMISIQEMWPIAVLAVLFFGGKKLPELARAMGTSITQFKKGLKDDSAPGARLEGEESEAKESDPE